MTAGTLDEAGAADRIDRAVAAAGAGRPVVILAPDDAAIAGQLVLDAQTATEDGLRRLRELGTGFVGVTLPAERLTALGLDPATTTQWTSADLLVGGGPSDAQRAATVRALADPATTADALTGPGHVLAWPTAPGGVLARAGRVDSAADLIRLAGGAGVAVLSPLVDPATREIADHATVLRVAAAEGLDVVSIPDVVGHRMAHERLVERVLELSLPTRHGAFRCVAFRSTVDGTEHVALISGEIEPDAAVLARVQRSRALDDVFGIAGADAGLPSQLTRAMARIAAAPPGVIVYLRPYSDLGSGLVQDVADRATEAPAPEHLPYLGYDERQHGTGAQILVDLGVRRMRLLTDHPGRHRGLDAYGLEVVGYVPLSPTE